ncbi:MAG: hypothetical protein JNK09_09210 [Prolixibacteraceae bacterium]|nr:hypothetical protein [Prolixibacteraceae bacterium]
MNTFLIYILESTICISLFYLLFRLLMRKETSFAVNRATLLTIVVASVIIPLVQLPQLMPTPVHVELIPDFSENKIQIQNLPATENTTAPEIRPLEPAPVANELTIPLETLLRYFYLAGVLVALLLFIRNIVLIFLLSRKATVQQMDGYQLLIVDREVPSFAFGRSVIISQADYDAHGQAILAHEQAHIRQNHFVDLLLLELVRTIHWFNPAVYALIGDLKEIHEFQADEQTLHSGIDAKQYQLLIIQKGVGPRRFALANSFNHCQIKKRITMMNKSKNSKTPTGKLLVFIPVMAFLLISFSFSKGENPKQIANIQLPSLNTSRESLQGTWRLVSFSWGKDTTMRSAKGNVERIKLITDNKFCWIHYGVDNHIVDSSAGGSYSLIGDSYIENLEFGGMGMQGYLGKSQKFTVKIEDNKLYLTGALSDGLKIKEVWERIISQ